MPKQLLGEAPPPIQDPVTGPRGLLSEAWRNWYARLPETLDSIPARINAVALSGGSSSITATDFSGGALLEGLYRATYYARITRAATTSSSLIISFTWTEGGVSQTAVGSPIVGNTTATGQSDSVLMRLDKGTVPRYATTYSSTGATSMLYDLNVVLEKILTLVEHIFRLLTPEEIAQVPGVINPRPGSFIMIGAVDEMGVYAACGAFLVLHADPIWIREDKRRNGKLLYRLWEVFESELFHRGVEKIEVGMTDTNPGQPTESLVERACLFAGGRELKARFFAVPIGAK